MKNRLILLLSVGALLAVASYSCADDDNYIYGTPYADFVMKGVVMNEKGDPLSDVVVANVMDSTSKDYYMLPAGKVGFWSCLTDEKGEYQFTTEYYQFVESSASSNGDLHFRFTGNNSLYEPFDTVISKESIVLSGGDENLYGGMARFKINVVLKSK